MLALQDIGFNLSGDGPLAIRDNLVASESQLKRLTFESFGVRVSIESDREELLETASDVAHKALLGKLTFIENPGSDIGHQFGIFAKNDVLYFFQNGQLTNHSESEFALFRFFNSMLRVTVAEYAVDTVFIHSGVVGWKSKAIVFPGRSFKGKSTLVAEMIGSGAEYYSDEYAVIGRDGLVQPFPRNISLRSYVQENDEVDVSPESLGAKIGTVPLSIGAVIITEFADGAFWRPKLLSIGQGILETIPHTIPIRANVEMSLNILNLAFADAIIAKSVRGDVKRDAVAILAFLDKHLN